MLEGACRILFGAFCHQDPSILMVIDGRCVTLCPRCVGLHLGFLLAFGACSFLFRRGLVLARTGARLLLFLGVASVAFDWGVGGRLGLYAPGTLSRLLTGLASGSSLAVLLYAYRTSLWMISPDAAASALGRDVAAVMLLSASTGVSLVGLSSWSLLTTVCAVAVLANVSLLVGTAVRMVSVRLRFARYAEAGRAA
jgi:uncharacterized membrane protein